VPSLMPVIHVLNSHWHKGFRPIWSNLSPVVTLQFSSRWFPNLASRLVSFDENERSSIQQVNSVLCLFAFLITEEIATADDQPVAAWLVETLKG
jgi:hypothetical protein